MKRSVVALVVLTAALWTTAEAEERTVTLHVENMTCALCPITVGRAIEQVRGVTQVEVSVADKTAMVDYDDAVATVADITLATGDAGYPSWPIKR